MMEGRSEPQNVRTRLSRSECPNNVRPDREHAELCRRTQSEEQQQPRQMKLSVSCSPKQERQTGDEPKPDDASDRRFVENVAQRSGGDVETTTTTTTTREPGVASGRTRSYVCKECDKSFRHLGNLNSHRRVHTGERPFRCAHCDKRFNQLGSLKTHLRLHTGEKPFYCTQCGKGFSHVSNMRTHRRAVHAGERPFGCARCGKSFAELATLRKHQRVHTGERPFHCTACDRRYRQTSSLKRHVCVST